MIKSGIFHEYSIWNCSFLDSVSICGIQAISQVQLQNDFHTLDGLAEKPEPPASYVNNRCTGIELGKQVTGHEPPNQSTAVTPESQLTSFHTLILDLGGVCFIDLMGIKVLTKFIQ